jgi:hypothetical protein
MEGRVILAILSGIGLLASSPVASPQAPTTDASAAPVPKKICQRIVPTGSIMPKKFCLTAAEWKEFTARTNAGAEQFLARRGTGTCDIKCLPAD